MPYIPDRLRKLEGRLIASCQAPDGDAFRDPESMARFALATLSGGAAGVRANGPEDIRAIRAVTNAPIIGIQKAVMADGKILITPTLEAARLLIDAGTDAIALDVTTRGQRFGALERIRLIKNELRIPVLADIATMEEGLAAAEAGADFVLSTMRGYTEETANTTGFEPLFIRELVRHSPVPVIAEGRIHTPERARQAIEAGAFAVIVGTAITRPQEIARTFARAIDAQYRARQERRSFAGIDMGGTKTKFGLVSKDGEIMMESAVPTPARAGREALLEHLTQIGRTIVKRARETNQNVAAVGIATAGWVDVKTGVVAYATDTLPGWTGARIAETVGDQLKVPVYAENDANALALAEKQFGAGRDFSDFICITLGTGVGGGCLVRGELNRGAHYFANAFGHINVEPDGLECNCGKRGCLEVYCNAAALSRYASEDFGSTEQVISSANAGDSQAAAALTTFAGYLARGCASLIQLLDPEALIISGGLAQGNALLLELLKSALAQMVPVWEQRRIAILASPLGYHGGVLGAAALAMNRNSEF
jgi:N-acetylmannosamine-6-phosphate 2-epimerase/N-acetylmannosamine kinase